jgi:hypothetical protein
MRSVTPLIRWPVLIALVTLVLIVAPVGVSTSADSSIAFTGPVMDVPDAGQSPGPGQAVASPIGTAPGDNAPAVFGIAQPGGSIPRATGPNGAAAWQNLSDQLHESGVCWLRTDMTPRLADAIRTFSWLGGPGPCSASGGTQVKVLAILDDQTMWSAERLCPSVTFSDVRRANRNQFTLSDWTLVVHCVATAFRGRISAYEIWNEPELPNSVYGYQDGTAAHYADMLRTAHDAIKAVDQDAIVIALGGSDLYAGAQGAARLAHMRQFSKDLVRLGAANDADAISLHAYPWGAYGDAVWASYVAELNFQRDLWGKPAWVTETGHRANESGSQIDYLVAAYRLFMDDGVDRVFWFALTDQPDGEFGIEGRPVQAALRDFVLRQATAGTSVPRALER